MNLNDLVSELSGIGMFAAAEKENLTAAAKASEILSFSKGDDMISGEPALYVVLSGNAVVRRAVNGQSVTLNSLSRGSVFGAAQLFGGGTGVTAVTASCRCRCLRISQDTVSELLKKDHGFVTGYITFLSDRIRFLNKRIASFTAGNGEKTLSDYLLSLPSDGGSIKLTVSMARLASALNVSRPTLYRAFASLCEQKIIEKDGNTVKILSKEKLSSI